jgi:outer membrane immunogenic protein
LFYFTGGFAGGRVADTIFISNPGTVATANLTDSTSRSGYVVGGGVEYAFDRHWSFKTEYQYINLGSGTPVGPIVPPPGTITSTTVKDNFQTVRGGLNFRF